MLILPIKKKWFDMILSGKKKEEYREIKPYWNRRLINVFGRGLYIPETNTFVADTSEDKYLGKGKPQYVLFRNGYGIDKPTIKCLVDLERGYGKEEWGAEPNKEYYILKILSVEKLKDSDD